jgi:hypothetical protein
VKGESEKVNIRDPTERTARGERDERHGPSNSDLSHGDSSLLGDGLDTGREEGGEHEDEERVEGGVGMHRFVISMVDSSGLSRPLDLYPLIERRMIAQLGLWGQGEGKRAYLLVGLDTLRRLRADGSRQSSS